MADFWQPGLEKRSPLFDRSATNQKDDSGNQQKIWREKFFDDPRRLPEFGFVDFIYKIKNITIFHGRDSVEVLAAIAADTDARCRD